MENQNKKILIVEDDESLVKVLSDKFNQKNFEVLTAKNGKDGLELALQEKPDLILLDIMMPIMDGMTLLQKLREDTTGKNVPVIILSNLGGSETVLEANKLGVIDYLVKMEWKLEDIVGKVKNYLVK